MVVRYSDDEMDLVDREPLEPRIVARGDAGGQVDEPAE